MLQKVRVFFCVLLYVGSRSNAQADTEADVQELTLLVKRQGEALQILEQQHREKAKLIDKLQGDILQQRDDLEKLKTEEAKKDEVIKTLTDHIDKFKRPHQYHGQVDEVLLQHEDNQSSQDETFQDSQENENVKQHVQRSDDVTPLEAVVSQLSQRVTEYSAQLQSLNNAVTQVTGSVYTRWGSRSCLSTSQLVYTGVIGGASYAHSGGATNSLCLPINPAYTIGAHMNVAPGYAGLYGTEYEVTPEAAHNRKSVCAVCLSSKPHIVMIPVTNACPSGWTLEYSGYIMADLPSDGRSGTEYICVNSSLEGILGSEAINRDEHVLYYAKTYCGSLPCPPFVDGQVVNCVVCSR